MSEEENKAGNSKIWSLEEIDRLLSDSVRPAGQKNEAADKELKREEQRRLSRTRDDFIDPRPTYNADIEHRINRQKVERSSPAEGTRAPVGVMESDKYRERFINRPVQTLEKTAEHTAVYGAVPGKPIEREGVIKREPYFNHTQDLAPLPTLVSPEEVLAEDALSQKTRVNEITGAQQSEKTESDVNADALNQLRLEGFDESEEPAEKVDEQEVERALWERRREKAKDFELLRDGLSADGAPAAKGEAPRENITYHPVGKAPREDAASFETEEYRFADDRVRFNFAIKKRYKARLFSFFAECAVFLLLAVFTAIPLMGDGVSFDFFSGSEKLFLISCLLLWAVGAAAGYKTMLKGLKAVLRGNPDAASCTVLAVTASLIQLISLFFTKGIVLVSTPLFLPAAVAALAFTDFGELCKLRRILLNFGFITRAERLSTVESIPGEDEAFEIGRGLLLGEPDIKMSFRTLFPARFMELSQKRFTADELSKKMVPIVFGAATLAGIVVGLLQKNVYMGISTFAAVTCIGLPASAYLADNLLLNAISKRLVRDGAVISGFEALDSCVNTNAVVLDATEIFDISKCNIYGIKVFHSMRMDEAILYTAAMIIEAKAPLSGVFNSVILGKRDILPPVDSLAYEDKLGLSAWIHNRRVLVGSRDMLINHNADVPDRDFEKRYLHDGRCLLYLAVDGKLAAMFVVSYEANTALSPLVREVEKSGVTLLVKTADQNITEELISGALRLPAGSTKVLSAVAGGIFEECRNEVRTSADAHILHDGSVRSMLSALCAVFSLGSFRNLTTIVQIVGGVIGAAFTAVLAFSSNLVQIGALRIVFYQVFWAGVTILLLKLKNKK